MVSKLPRVSTRHAETATVCQRGGLGVGLGRQTREANPHTRGACVAGRSYIGGQAMKTHHGMCISLYRRKVREVACTTQSD